MQAEVSDRLIDEVPVIIPENARKAIGEGYDFLEVLSFPQKGTNGIYGVEIAVAVMRSLLTRPIPGSKYGHSEETHDDFFVIGALIFDDRGNVVRYEKDAVEEFNLQGIADRIELALRVRVPPTDFMGNSNEGFIRSIKTGNQRFSLVLHLGDAPPSGVYRDLISYAGLRNDAVGTIPAMKEQEIIANSWVDRENELLALVKGNKICEVDSEEMIVNDSLNLTAVRNIRPHDNKLRNRILNAVDKSRRNSGGEMTEEEVKKIVDAAVKDAVGAAVKEAVVSMKESSEKEEQTKKNSAEIETAAKILAEARVALGEGFEESPPEAVFEALVKMLGTAEDQAAEVEAGKFLGNKFEKNSALFEHCKKSFKTLGRRVFNGGAKEALIKNFDSDIVFKELRKNAYNPISGQTDDNEEKEYVF
jgi:hypothetical protein